MNWKEKLMKPFDLYEVSKIRPYLMGIAALWVTLYHCKYLNLFNSSFLTNTRLLGIFTRIEASGNCGVDLFFFLSGLGLFFSYARLLESDPHPLKTFYQRRFRRILPTILIVTILTYGLIEVEDLANWAGYVFLYGFLTPTLERGNFWYFSFTVVLYLVYPLVHRALTVKKGVLGAGGIILASVAVTITVSLLAEKYFYMRGILMLSRIPVFVLGAYMGRLCYHHRKIPVLFPLLAIPVSVVLLILILDCPLSPAYLRFYEFCILVLCIALGHAFIFSKFRKRGFLSKSVMLIGSYSMEIYLLFESVYNNGTSLFNSPESTGLVYALTAFTATLVLAVILKFVAGQLVRTFDAQGSSSAQGKKEAVQ